MPAEQLFALPAPPAQRDVHHNSYRSLDGKF